MTLERVDSKTRIILGLSVAAFFVGAALVGFSLNFSMIGSQSSADKARQLTQDLDKATNNYLRASARGKQSAEEKVIVLAAKRKQVMLELAINDPNTFVGTLVSAETIKKMPASARSLVEQDVELEGELTAIHIEYEDAYQDTAPQRHFEYSLKDASGNDIRLISVDEEIELQTGSVIRVKGKKLDDTIVIAGAAGGSKGTVTTSVVSSTGPQKFLVLLVNFIDNPAQPFTPEGIQDRVFSPTGTSSVTYYNEVSFGKVAISGDVMGWFTVGAPSSGGCAYKTWADLANAAATSAGIDVASYARVGYVFAQTTTCTWSALGTIGGTPSAFYVHGNRAADTFIHEMGHNLGVHHAGKWYCGSKSIDVYANCQTSEYGDFQDIMGGGTYLYGHFNPPHKYALKWLTSTQVQTVSTRAGTYTYDITTSYKSDGAIKLLKIAKPDTNESYYIGYPWPSGSRYGKIYYADRKNQFTGARIYIWNGLASKQTRLLDTHPLDSASSPDEAFADGTIFVDAANGITVRQISHNSEIATIQVTIERGSGGGKK